MDQGTGYDYEQLPQEPARGSNPLAVVGFVLAFCLPPVGLLLSLIAVFMRPRGFAIAGLIVSLITTSIAGVLVGGGVYMWPAMKTTYRIVEDTTAIKQAIETHQRNNNDVPPADLSILGLSASTLTDPWGTAYLYEVSPDGTSWTLKVAGPDGGFDDRETVTITPDMQPNEIGNVVGNTLGEAIMREHLRKK